MSGGVTTAACLLATLAVCESVVPRFYAEWRHRRRKVREDKERADEAAARLAPEKPREAVGGHGEYWPFRETLAAILIRRAKLEEGERELERAEALAEKAGLRKGAVVSLVLDRARLLKARGDAVHFRIAIRVLRGRQDLTAEQKAEVGELDR